MSILKKLDHMLIAFQRYHGRYGVPGEEQSRGRAEKDQTTRGK